MSIENVSDKQAFAVWWDESPEEDRDAICTLAGYVAVYTADEPFVSFSRDKQDRLFAAANSLSLGLGNNDTNEGDYVIDTSNPKKFGRWWNRAGKDKRIIVVAAAGLILPNRDAIQWSDLTLCTRDSLFYAADRLLSFYFVSPDNFELWWSWTTLEARTVIFEQIKQFDPVQANFSWRQIHPDNQRTLYQTAKSLFAGLMNDDSIEGKEEA